MEEDKRNVNKIKIEFQKRRSRRITLFVFALVFLLVVGFFIMPFMDYLNVPRLAWAPFVYLIAFGIIVAIAFVWRCPVCNGLLGDVFTSKYCPKCGFNFTENEKRINKE